jgi:uncharacterized protein with von Willebrand factor type A (vWA) domain
MDKRVIEFIRALRTAGVRISLAESQDALRAVEHIGIQERAKFRAVLKTTLIKEQRDQGQFDQFFALFFDSGEPIMQHIPDGLSPEEQAMLDQALQQMGQNRLQSLMQRLLNGHPFSQEELQQMAQQAGLSQADMLYQRHWFENRMTRQQGLHKIREAIDALMDALEASGMSAESRAKVRALLQENTSNLLEQISQFVGTQIAENMSEQERPTKPDLTEMPFSQLGHNDVESIREEIQRLAARLRSRASLRQKRAKAGTADPRKTLRASLRYGGVPLEIKHRNHPLKPSLVLICDLSTSMRYCAEFLLTLVYELQDQVRRTHSYIFIDDMVDISMAFAEYQPRQAVQHVLEENPPGYYSTDLGNSLNSFQQKHMSVIDHRSTVIILGDGRNNYNNPRVDIAEQIQRRARRVIWFNPEPRTQWGTGDSDMWEYYPHANEVFRVTTLRELANAVDQLLGQ